MYVNSAQIQTAIPAPHLNDACDDDHDGAADSGVLDAIISQACQAVDAFLAPRYEVPFTDPAPPACREAAFVFAAELVYDRRQVFDKNPFKDRADDWRERLEKIGAGQGTIDASLAEEAGADWGSANIIPTRLSDN